MNIALVLFTLGIILITFGYMNQIVPYCNQEIKVKVVPRDVHDQIMQSKEMVEEVYNDMR
jgi:hypothetical protein|tara:strand:- start:429 stop:608 length:180 start_codon:yes stop_codon:yes gene_type:complete